MGSPQHVRRNVRELGKPWADPILWYARAVKAMKQRPLSEPTSWWFYAAIHGFSATRWQHMGQLSSTSTPPSQALQSTFWKQCQHSSWYFLPWHRGYLLCFEAVVRDVIVSLNGPADWTLPYWNYFKAKQADLPPAFATKSWPDGATDNPLFVAARYGPNNDGNVFVDLSDVDLKAMNEPLFTGGTNGGSRGFGGPDTGFVHSADKHGQLEHQPHDQVHVDVGGGFSPQDLGLMSHPDTAGLDPIFWLHHANIDRLWESWRRDPVGHQDPANARWLDGPAGGGEREFVMPMPGNTTRTYTPRDMHDLSALDYGYDDYTPGPVPTPTPPARMALLGASPQAAEGAPVAGTDVELIGANQGPLQVAGDAVRTDVPLEPAPRDKVRTSLARVAEDTGDAGPAVPDRVFLNLENIRGQLDSATLRVYVSVVVDDVAHPEQKAGSVGLFGLMRASDPDGEHGGNGLSFALDITDIVDQWHLEGGLDADHLEVRIVPRTPIPQEDEISVGRVSVYREGA